MRALARHLGLPQTVIDQPATAGFRVGRTDEADLGAPYDTLDEVLARLVEGDIGTHRTADELDLDIETVTRCAQLHAETRHKRIVPPTTETRATADRPDYFHEVELNFR